MKTGTENYSKVEVLNLELNLGNISVIYNTNKPKYTNNVKRIIDYGWKNQKKKIYKRRKII